MKVIIAGSRNFNEMPVLIETINNSKFEIEEVVSGAANGVDRLGEEYALMNNIKLVRYPAQWDVYGKSAGYKRNEQMADYADALIFLWANNSKGTHHMIDTAFRKGLEIYGLKFNYDGKATPRMSNITNIVLNEYVREL